MPMIAPTSVLPAGSAFRCAMQVRWGDLDALNHVNNTVYFRFFEEARARLLSLAGIMPPSAKVGVLAHTSCDFLKPLMYPATVIVTQTLVRVGRSSIEMDVLVEREDEPGVLYAKGRYILVGTDSSTGASLPWTEAELAHLAESMKS